MKSEENKMNQIKFQPHRRYHPSRRSYGALICSTDIEQDVGHFWRRVNGIGAILCPFRCRGRAVITDEDRLLGHINVAPDVKCKGAIKDYAKFSFAGIAEGGQVEELPDWTRLIRKSNMDDPVVKIIQQIGSVSKAIILSESCYCHLF